MNGVTLVRTTAELHTLVGAPKRLLVVLAHPDDESYGCAGALARAGADPDTQAVLLCLTRGEASSMGRERGLSPAEVGQLREGRLVEVAALCGLGGLLVLDLPDGGLDRLALREVAAPIREVIEAFDPQVVVTGDARGVNGHRDHIAAHWAVRRALEDAPPRRLALLAYPPAVCEAAKPRLLFATPEARIDVSLELTPAEIATKEACLRVHEAIVTLTDAADPDGRAVRPPLEHFDLHGESFSPRAVDLFANVSPGGG